MSKKIYSDESIIEAYLNLKNKTQICKQFNISFSGLTKLLKRNNIKSFNYYPPKIIKNEDYFQTIDTEEKAYFLGLLYADGCNHSNSNRVEIGLQEGDEKPLLILSNILFDKNIIYDAVPNKEKHPTWKTIKRLTFANKKISKDLSFHGVVKNKTFLIKFPSLNNENLYKGFIRGYFDGDGSLSFYKYSQTQKYRFTLKFTSNIEFNLGLKKYIEEIFDTNCSFYKYRNVSDLTVNSRSKIIEILDWLYKDTNLYIDRKYERFLKVKEEFERVKKVCGYNKDFNTRCRKRK